MTQASTVVGGLVEKIYDEAYALLLETRNYMAYVAPSVRKAMAPEDRLFVTYHSTRLTSRLLEMMSWLMAQKAILGGEMTAGEAREQGFVISNDSICSFDESEQSGVLPQGLRTLLSRSRSLYERLERLDGMMATKKAA
jgi:regulator of CtrA degradation